MAAEAERMTQFLTVRNCCASKVLRPAGGDGARCAALRVQAQHTAVSSAAVVFSSALLLLILFVFVFVFAFVLHCANY